MERNDDNNEVIRNARKKAKDNKENFTKDKEENKELDNSEEINLNLNNEENVSNQEDLTKATEQTTKAAKGQLASFDELNQLTKETAGTDNALLGASAKQQIQNTARPRLRIVK